MGGAAPARARGHELHPVAQRLAREDVEQPEAQQDGIAVDGDLTGHQRLGPGGFPGDIVDGAVKARGGRAFGFGHLEQAGALQVIGDDGGDVAQQIARVARVFKAQGDGHRADHAFGDLDPQGGVLRQRRQRAEQRSGQHSKGGAQRHVMLPIPLAVKVIWIWSQASWRSFGRS